MMLFIHLLAIILFIQGVTLTQQVILRGLLIWIAKRLLFLKMEKLKIIPIKVIIAGCINKMKFAYFILIPAIIIWSPFIAVYVISTLVCLSLAIKCFFSKLYIIAEILIKALTKIVNDDKYLKFAVTSSYLLIFIMVIVKILS